MSNIELQECAHCRREVDKRYLSWVNDRYGIPFKKVCDNCYDEVKESILEYVHDYMDAGEELEPEDY